jgi:hypothetical protein
MHKDRGHADDFKNKKPKAGREEAISMGKFSKYHNATWRLFIVVF